MIGDIPAAARLAPDDTDPAMSYRGLATVTRAVEALAADRGAEVEKILDGAQPALPGRAALLVLKPYAEAEAGDWDKAVAPHPFENERLVALLDQTTRAQLLELRGRTAEAEALYKALVDDSITAGLFAQPYGEFLERHGRAKDAVAVYEKGLAASPGDPELISDRDRAVRASGASTPPALSIKRGAADAMTYAAGAAAGERQAQLSLFYARLALRLDPKNGQAWLYCGDALSAGKDETAARACWSHVEPGTRTYAEARTRTAYSLQGAGDLEGALAVGRELAKDPGHRVEGELLLAELLRTANRFAEADQALSQVLTWGGTDWRVYYMRAAVRERLGRWPEAETDLKTAMKMAPNEPELLNFLGYQWIDRGEDLKGGLALIERAVKARPNSGPMLDSLGWAHFKLGEYPDAVTDLERAVLLEPADAEINDHLGDAYWMVGRKDEASYQWRRVLTFGPDDAVKARAEAKLKDGLIPKAQVAGQ